MTSQQQFDQYNSFIKVIDNLSAKISLKTKELDEYKNNYNAKIKQLNKYIKSLGDGLVNVEFNDNINIDAINKKSTLQLLKGDNSTWRDEEGNEFLIIPIVKNTNSNSTSQEISDITSITKKTDTLSICSTSTPITTSTISSNGNINHLKKSKRKKNCSYCHEVGHSRAMCPKKL